jgi:hypothetical protein
MTPFRYSVRIVSALLVAFALAGFARSSHAAGGVNLSWGDCGAFGTATKSFACDTNVGSNVLYVSAIPPVPMPQVNGMTAFIVLEINQAALSPWWSFQGAGCHTGGLVADYNFLAGPFNCQDLWTGQFSGGAGYTAAYTAANRGRIFMSGASASNKNLNGINEAYLARVSILNTKTVGTGSCAGCTNGACLYVQSVLLTQPIGVGDQTITTPLQRLMVGWQPAGTTVPPCTAATPARNETWGAIKSIYR